MDPAGDAPARADMLDELHRRFDGPLPRGARQVVKAGGLAAWARLRDRADLKRALAAMATARQSIARRRLDLADPCGDPWLSRLTAEIAALRAGAVQRQFGQRQFGQRQCKQYQSLLCDPSHSGDLAVALQPQK